MDFQKVETGTISAIGTSDFNAMGKKVSSGYIMSSVSTG